jgi:hypothetical protein
MKVGYCPRCNGEVRDGNGFCLLGHALYPWSEEMAARRRSRGDARKRALRGAAIGLVIYSIAAGVLLQLRRPASIESARFTSLESARPVDFRTTSERGRDRRATEPAALIAWRLGIYAPVEPLGLNDDGSIQVPTDAAKAGWYEGGPTPGRNGPSVIVGHFDSSTGPGVFFPLRKLRVGDEVGVVARNGDEFVFEITRIEQVDKDMFPTKSVYGSTRKATLRLITCEGDIDPMTGHYSDNLIAYGKLVE